MTELRQFHPRRARLQTPAAQGKNRPGVRNVIAFEAASIALLRRWQRQLYERG